MSSTECFKDFVFITVANETEVPCQDDSHGVILLVLYSFLAISTIVGNLFTVWAVCTTKNVQARNRLFGVLVPSILFLALNLSILSGVKTGHEGVANIVLFGLFYLAITFFVLSGISGVRSVAMGALKLKLKVTKFDIFLTPAMQRLDFVCTVLSFMCSSVVAILLCVVFPLSAPINPLPLQQWVERRDAIWDLAIYLAIFNNEVILFKAMINLHIFIVSLRANMKDMKNIQHSSKPDIESVLFAMNLGLLGTVICGILMSVILVSLLYAAKFPGSPTYYGMFVFFLANHFFAQHWTNFTFRPKSKSSSKNRSSALVITATAGSKS